MRLLLEAGAEIGEVLNSKLYLMERNQEAIDLVLEFAQKRAEKEKQQVRRRFRPPTSSSSLSLSPLVRFTASSSAFFS